MTRRWVSITAVVLIAPTIQACSHWVMHQAPLDQVVEKDTRLRIITTDDATIELKGANISSDMLCGVLSKRQGNSAFLIQCGIQSAIPMNIQPSESFTVALSSIKSARILNSNWGWVEVDRQLLSSQGVSKSFKPIQIECPGTGLIILRTWHVAADSLYGSWGGQSNQEWVAIPPSRIQSVSVRRSNVPATILLSFGIVTVSVFSVIALAFAFSDENMSFSWN